MKKLALLVAVLLIATPAMADVVFTIVDEGGLVARIDYVADANVSAFGLIVTIDAGTIDAISDYHVGESVTGSKGYGIFPGTIDINSVTGLPDNYGTPVAPDTDPCAAGTGLSTTTVILEMGALYEDGNQPALSGTLCKLTVSEGCLMSLVAEPTRGGVVYADASSATPDVIAATDVEIAGAGCPTCLGDLNGDNAVRTNDLGMLINDLTNEGAPYIILPASSNWRDCSDLNGDGAIRTNDLGMLINNLTNAGAPYIIPCP